MAYNREFKKIYLEGSNNLCELVPLASKKGSKFLHLTTQANMVYGYGDGLADEKATVVVDIVSEGFAVLVQA